MGLPTEQNQETSSGLFLSAIGGETTRQIPFWFMRQAGRYLPEYRALRAEAGGFLDLVYNPEFATEVTIQPLRRFGMSAAILFSDILVIPQALGQDLRFVPGQGPNLPPLENYEDIDALAFDPAVLNPVYKSVSSIRTKISEEGFEDVPLIGFSGSPWTISTYMIEGGSSRQFEKVKKWAYSDPDSFTVLIEKIVQATIFYLQNQIEAGAQTVQLFDSWAGVLDEGLYEKWVIDPTARIVSALQDKYPHIPVIGFPKGSGVLYERYANETGINAMGLDSSVPIEMAVKLQKILPVQGNLDPVCLLAGGPIMRERAEMILNHLSDGPFIFNLGHGVIKETPPEHVLELSEIVRNWER
jgi:uroporphyrinogen decarboxylase